ncbi:putative Urease accessory protein F [Hypsibius exemplaris]|uniref:Urease accessory protein F n=1 Tax=Hypsibius exemplaris TaxID=2072580 RepID=A0A1W0X929_HYPEX|nr:putative Urease accessory protein F [Hypsibius exemplaris]
MNFDVLQLIDSAFPIGSFAHSGGLEAVCTLTDTGFRGPRGDTTIRDGPEFEKFEQWTLCILENAGCLQVPFVRDAIGANGNIEEIAQLDRKLHVLMSNHVGKRASLQQGKSLAALVRTTFSRHPQAECFQALSDAVTGGRLAGHFPVVFGFVCSVFQLDAESAAGIFLFGVLRALIGSAVRLGLFGPIKAQETQNNLQCRLPDLIERSLVITEPHICHPVLEIAQSAHDKILSYRVSRNNMALGWWRCRAEHVAVALTLLTNAFAVPEISTQILPPIRRLVRAVQGPGSNLVTLRPSSSGSTRTRDSLLGEQMYFDEPMVPSGHHRLVPTPPAPNSEPAVTPAPTQGPPLWSAFIPLLAMSRIAGVSKGSAEKGILPLLMSSLAGSSNTLAGTTIGGTMPGNPLAALGPGLGGALDGLGFRGFGMDPFGGLLDGFGGGPMAGFGAAFDGPGLMSNPFAGLFGTSFGHRSPPGNSPAVQRINPPSQVPVDVAQHSSRTSLNTNLHTP